VARPPKLDEQTIEDIARLVRVGTPISGAAQTVGISTSTFYSWLERGESTKPADAPYRKFREAIEQARAEGEVLLVQRIQNAAAKGSWQAAAYLLERRYSDNWRKDADHDRQNQSETETQKPDGQDRGREILDELATRRERRG
jgi:transposase